MYPLTVVYPNRVIKANVAQLQAQHDRSVDDAITASLLSQFQVSRGLATTMYKHHTQTGVKVQRQAYNPMGHNR